MATGGAAISSDSDSTPGPAMPDPTDEDTAGVGSQDGKLLFSHDDHTGEEPFSKRTTSQEAESSVRHEGRREESEEIRRGRVVECSTAANANTILMAIEQLIQRRVHQYDRMQQALLESSKALETKVMINHLEKVLDNSPLERRNEADYLRPKLMEFRTSLYAAVANNDLAEVTDVQGAVESLLLSFDPKYLEKVEARKLEFRQAVKDNEPPKPTPSWKQNPTFRFLSMLKGDFTGEKNLVSQRQVRFFLSRGAWTLALVLMTIAIVFVSVQFSESRFNPALSTDVNHYDQLQLPVIWACLTKPLFPMFKNISNQGYVGWQTWGLRTYTNTETGETYSYPETEDIVSEPKILGPDDYCNDSMNYFSKRAIVISTKRLFEENTRCYSCLRIGVKKPVTLEYKKALSRPAGAVTLEFAILKDLDFCFSHELPVHGYPRSVLKADLKRNGQLLVDKGAVVLENNIGIDFALDYGFESFDQLRNPYFKIEAEASVFCNLFFFSGVFYPVREEERIRYRFDIGRGIDAWEPLGDPSNFLVVKVQSGAYEIHNVNRTDMLEEFRLTDFDVSRATQNSVKIFSVVNTTNEQPTVADLSGVLRERANDIMVYTRNVESGQVAFLSRLQRGTTRVFRVQSRFRRFNVSLDFAAFDVEVSVKVPTTTWAEFLTDVFEYVGLFTGICAYSLLVSPAKMYFRRVQKYEQHRAKFSAPTK